MFPRLHRSRGGAGRFCRCRSPLLRYSSRLPGAAGLARGPRHARRLLMSVPFKVDLSGKVAVVTGGTGVLCSAMARALGECGAGVAVLGRRKEVADELAAEIRKDGGKAIGVSADVLDRAKLDA